MMLLSYRAISDLSLSIARRRVWGKGIHHQRLFLTKEDSSTSQTSPLSSTNESTAPPAIATPIPSESTSTKHKQYTASSPPRPLFPWRHELVPPPRLLRGTPEYKEAPPSLSLGFLGRRAMALWFLQLRPVWSVVTGRFETELATAAAYAFGQAVAGIVSNVYRIPFASVGTEGHVKFRYDPSSSSEDGAVKGQKREGVNKGVTSQNAQTRRRSKRNRAGRRQAKGRASVPKNRPILHRSSRSLIYLKSTSSGAKVYRRAPRRLLLRKSLQRSRNTRRTRRRKEPTHISTTATTDESLEEESQGPQGTYCSNIGDMVSPQLRELYESAHASGKDQLLVHLDMEPLSGRFISLTAFPLCNRKMAAEDPARFRRLHALHKSGSFQEGNQTFQREFDREGYLETTIELQVWVQCKEQFSVVDRVTGATVQGHQRESHHPPQLVGHLVRLEASARVTREPSAGDHAGYLTVSNWIVTDIDDLLGHKTWYHVLLDDD